jgi:hypothetical protein
MIIKVVELVVVIDEKKTGMVLIKMKQIKYIVII